MGEQRKTLDRGIVRERYSLEREQGNTERRGTRNSRMWWDG